MTVPPSRRRGRAALAALLGLAGAACGALAVLSATAVAPVEAAPITEPAAAAGSTIRVAHFSPDTPRMDVYAAGFDGAESLVLPKLGFGEVSQYMNLPAGTYAFSMRPHGSPATSTAALRVSASLSEGGIYTFAAFGRSDELETDLLTDDMTAPGAGQARVRIIQGAGDSGPVDVTTSANPLFAVGARLGTVGSYATVPAGAIDITASAGGVDDTTARLDVAAGTVSSVVVLDQPTGEGLQVIRVTDGTGTPGGTATPTGMPAGGVDTGGGSTASERTGADGVPVAVAAATGAAAVAAAVWFAALVTGGRVRRRPRGRADTRGRGPSGPAPKAPGAESNLVGLSAAQPPRTSPRDLPARTLA
jgi:Domain of unknown function (DUF4397)